MSKLLLLALVFFCGGWFVRNVSVENNSTSVPKEGEEDDKIPEPSSEPLKGFSEGGLYNWIKIKVEELLAELEAKDAITDDDVLQCTFFIDSFERVCNNSNEANKVKDAELVKSFRQRLNKLKVVEEKA